MQHVSEWDGTILQLSIRYFWLHKHRKKRENEVRGSRLDKDCSLACFTSRRFPQPSTHLPKYLQVLHSSSYTCSTYPLSRGCMQDPAQEATLRPRPSKSTGILMEVLRPFRGLPTRCKASLDHPHRCFDASKDYGQFRSQLSNGCLEKPPVFEPTKPPPPLAMNLTALRLKRAYHGNGQAVLLR